MKNLVVLVFVVLISGSVYAQEDLENQFYIRIGKSLPSWSSYGADGKAGTQGIKRTGGVFEMGSLYMINKLPLAEGLRLGINVDWISIDYHGFTYRDDVIVDVGILSKIGPSISYSPIDKLVFDAYAKVVVSWASGVGLAYNGEDLEEEDTYIGTGGLKHSLGLNARYSKLILGIAYNAGALTLKNPDGAILGDIHGNSKTPLSSVNFTVGVSF
ncbi:MAG: hypothetical protein WD426_03135 [Anditalea sp.]